MIVRNSAYCFNCDTEIYSQYQHDFQVCKCSGIFVDGGLDYIRHGWAKKEEYLNTSIEA